MPRRLLTLLFAFLMIATAGCGRQGPLNVDRDFEIEGGEFKQWEIDGPKSDQKINVLLRTSGQKLDLYVVTAGDFAALSEQLGKQATVTAKTLAKKEQVSEGQLEATVPAGQKFYVVVSNPKGKSSKASLKVTSN